MAARTELDGSRRSSVDAVAQLRDAALRPEVLVRDARSRSASPRTRTRMSGDVASPTTSSAPAASSCCTTRPATTRGAARSGCVTFARADIEAEMASRPGPPPGRLELADRGARRRGRRRTSRRAAASRSCAPRASAAMDDDGADAQIEVRASWTPACGPEPASPLTRGVDRPAVHRRRAAARSHPASCRFPRRGHGGRPRRRPSPKPHADGGPAPVLPPTRSCATRCPPSSTPPTPCAHACAAICARHGPDRPRRRARLGLPLLPARLPRPGASRGVRHRADRPDRLRQPEPARHRLRGDEWILHAATQDLPVPGRGRPPPRLLFDTELAGRLLNLPRVGLAALVRALPRAEPGQGVLGRRLVDASAARAVAASTPRSTSRCCVELRDVLDDPARGGRQARVGARGVRGAARVRRARPSARSRGDVRRASTRSAADAGSPSSAPCGRPATPSPESAT